MDIADRAQDAETQQREDAIKGKKRGKPSKKLCYRCGLLVLDVDKDNLCSDCAEAVASGAAAPMHGPPEADPGTDVPSGRKKTKQPESKAEEGKATCSKCQADVDCSQIDAHGWCLKCQYEEADRERKKKQAVGDYQKLVSDVRDLQAMTDTRAFKEFVRRCRKKIEEAKERLLVAEKSNEIAHAQEEVKVLKKALDEFREPVDQLQKYVADMPLFAPEFTVRAQWMADLFTVDIREGK